MTRSNRLHADPRRRIAAAFLAALLAGCGGGGGPLAATEPADMDRDGILDTYDNDLDGDGRLNQFDTDVDGDSILNDYDVDADNDRIFNESDETPFGPWYPSQTTAWVTQGVTTLNFGDVAVGQTAGPGEASVQNDTITPLQCTRVALVGSASGAFTLDPSTLPSGGTPFGLSPGERATFQVTYRPKKAGGDLGRVELTLRDQAASFIVVVHLLGMGSAPALTPEGGGVSINFGDVPVGVTAGPAKGTLRNDTPSAYLVTRLALVGTGGGTYTLDTSGTPGPVPFLLAPGERFDVLVSYTPKEGIPNIGRAEVDLELGGTSTTHALDLLGQGVGPALTILPRPLDTGTALAGLETVEVPVTIRNEAYATGDLIVWGITFPDDSGGEFFLASNPAPFILAPGAAPVELQVKFRPAAGSYGLREGVLQVLGNDPHGDVDQRIDVSGRGAGWQAPDATIAGDLAVPAGPDAADPLWLADTTFAVVRTAGPNGTFGGAAVADDALVVIDADPDGDPTTADAISPRRFSGLRLLAGPAGAPVDAGDRRHVYFLSTGPDGSTGGVDDEINVLDVVSGDFRTLACPGVGSRKSLPVVVDAASDRVVVATGVGGLLISDALLVFENLVGNLTADGPSAIVPLGVAVPDFACCVPVAVSATTVAMLTADANDAPDPSDRRLDDGEEGVIQVHGLGGSPSVSRVFLDRFLTSAQTPTDGDAACRPVVVSPSSVLVATEGGLLADTTDDDVVRVDGFGGGALTLGASVAVGDSSGIASRPVPAGAVFVFAGPGLDLVYGTDDDVLFRLDAAGSMSLSAFGPTLPLAGEGGVATALVPFGVGVLVATEGPDGVPGSSDDSVLQVDVASSGPASILATLPLPGGALAATRATGISAAAPHVLDARFVAIADRGADGLEATGDEVLRIFRDRDGDGRLGEAPDDDLDADGAFGASDSATIELGRADANRTPVVRLGNGHFLTIEAGANGFLGTGGDDVPVVWWLQESATLP